MASTLAWLKLDQSHRLNDIISLEHRSKTASVLVNVSNTDCSLRYTVDYTGDSNIHERTMAHAAEERHPSPAAGTKWQAAHQQQCPTTPVVVIKLPNLPTVVLWQGCFFVIKRQGAHY